MNPPTKPRFLEPCNGCGLCCRVELCHAADMAFPGASAPCPALVRDPAGSNKMRCGLVLLEAVKKAEPLIAMSLGIGLGCGMRDDEQDIDYENQCVKPTP